MNSRHVPSLELCQEFDQRCKDKGIVVPMTEYYWIGDSIKNMSLVSIQNTYKITGSPFDGNMQQDEYLFCFPAPLVSEQGEWLGKSITNKDEQGDYMIDVTTYQDASGLWFCVRADQQGSPAAHTRYIGRREYRDECDRTEANARQKMLNYLIAEGIITTLCQPT